MIFRVRCAIDFDDEVRLTAKKIDSEWPNGILAGKFVVLQTSAT